MHTIVQQSINGLLIGGVYAILAVGYTLIFGVLRLVYLAFGASVTVGGYTGYWAVVHTHNVVLAIFLACVVGCLSGLLIDLLAVRFVKSEEHLVPLVSTVAIAAVTAEAFRVTVNNGLAVSYPDTILSGSLRLGAADDPYRIGIAQLAALGVSVVALVVVGLVLQRTWLGRGIRCVADSKDLARMLGVSVGKAYSVTVGLASALAGLGGVLLGISLPGISPYFGEQMQFNALAVVLFGGLGSVRGALVGGVLLGLGQAYSSAYLSGTITTAFSFLLVIVVLLFRPRGLFPSYDRAQ